MLEELKYVAFKEQFNNSYKNDLDKIIKLLERSKKEVKIKKYDLTLEDVLKKVRTPSYLSDLNLDINEDGMKVVIATKEFWNDIKNYIPKSITSLNIPFELIRDNLDYLKLFPNLTSLEVGLSTLTPEEIIWIYDNTNIRNINSDNFINYSLYYKNPDFALSDSPYDRIMYKDLVISPSSSLKENKDNELPSDYLIINANTLNIEQITSLYDASGNNKKKVILIKTETGAEIKIKFIDNNSAEAEVKGDILLVTKLNNYLENKGYNIKSITYDIHDINYFELDITNLKPLSNKLLIEYGSIKQASYEEFMSLYECIKWWRQIITDGNLSPVEKVMFATDILKTLKYKENEVKEDSRSPHRIIETGSIVCVGYCNLLKQILKDLDDNIEISDFSVKCYDKDNSYRGSHRRSLVKINDDKYNLHGIFSLDVTWDSIHEEVKNKTGEDYTALDLYSYFLIPASDYKNIFMYDSIPWLFASYLGDKSIQDSEMMNEYKQKFKEEISQDKLHEYLSVKRPSLETFIDILANVRLAEGYSKDELLSEIKKVNRINQYSSESFFKEEKKTK